MFQHPIELLDQKSSKRKYQEKYAVQIKHAQGDDEPDDYDEEQSNIVHRIKVSYVANDVARFDSYGRQIVRGGEFGIQFVNHITVCLFDKTEEVIQIKKNLEEFQTQKIQTRYKSKSIIKNETQITLYSSLKKK